MNKLIERIKRDPLLGSIRMKDAPAMIGGALAVIVATYAAGILGTL